MADNSWIFVDDRDPGIAYYEPPGATIWQGGVSQEYDQTTTGLDLGDTATYYFNASSIGVFGTYGPTGESGPPVAAYQVDNIPATTITAPITQATLYRQTFWLSDPQLPSLSPGSFHKLVVTATAPNNTLWVDYLAYPPTNSTAATSTTATSTASTGTSISTSTSTPTNIANGEPASGASGTKTNTAAMVAGIVVGTVALILAIAVLVYMWRRRSYPAVNLMQGEIDDSPDMIDNNHIITHTVTPYPLLSEDTIGYSSIPQWECSGDQLPRPLPSNRTFDGGVSLMGGPPEIPPEYQEHY